MPAGLQDGKTDYKSVTVAEDATAQEFMDFYLDDDARARWVRTALWHTACWDLPTAEYPMPDAQRISSQAALQQGATRR